MSSIKRRLEVNLPKGQSCFLWGARKTGKSTYLKQTFPDGLYINLLQADIYQYYLRNPERLREVIKSQDNASLIIIDEVQKVPLLLDEVHSIIEENKDISFILCGSSVRKLKTTGANLLGGRAWRYLFNPLCYPELKELDWDKIFNKGLIPSHYLAEDSVERSLAAYLYDYVLPEVQFESNLRKRDSFARFMDIVAISNGEMIKYNNIARDCGVDAKTIRSYFEILEDMYLGYMLQPFRSKAKRQIIKETPKFYFFDTGLVNYLKRYVYKAMLGIEAGRAFEHYIFLELVAYKNLMSKRGNVSYWRTKEGYEVDFVFENQAVEVKISTSIDKSHIKGLREFVKDHKGYKLNIVCLESKKRILSINDNEIVVWPVKEFLENLWANKIWE